MKGSTWNDAREEDNVNQNILLVLGPSTNVIVGSWMVMDVTSPPTPRVSRRVAVAPSFSRPSSKAPTHAIHFVP